MRDFATTPFDVRLAPIYEMNACDTCHAREVELRFVTRDGHEAEIACRHCFDLLPESNTSFFWDWPLVQRIWPANLSTGPERVDDGVSLLRLVLACALLAILMIALAVA